MSLKPKSGSLRNITFSSLIVQVLAIGEFPRVLVRWVLTPTTQKLKNLYFQVYRGESHLEMKPISHFIECKDLYEFIDTGAAVKNFNKEFLYKVVATEFIDETPVQYFHSDTKTWEIGEDLVATYIVEEHEFKYRYVGGEPCFVYKNRRQGEHCPECFDIVLKRVTKSNCQTCYGTGKLGGFFSPIAIWMDLNPVPEVVAIADFGERQIGQRDCEMTNYPIMDARDLIVTIIDGRTWRVENVHPITKRSTVIRQLLRLSEVNRSDVEYKLSKDETVMRALVNEFNEIKKEREF